MSVAEDNDERFDDEDDGVTVPVVMAQLILTNKVIENLLDDVTSRIEMIRQLAECARETIDDLDSTELAIKSILKITNRKPDLTFLEGFTEYDSDDDDE